jgi:cytochrome c oxidase subunit IV
MIESGKNLKSAHESSEGGHSHDEPHVMPLALYFAVFGALIVLTVITVGVSLLGLPPVASVVAAVAVATVKAALVAMYFMHLKYDNNFFTFIFAGAIFFIALFFVFTIGDMSARGWFIPEQATDYYRNEQINIKREASEASGSTSTPEAPR